MPIKVIRVMMEEKGIRALRPGLLASGGIKASSRLLIEIFVHKLSTYHCRSKIVNQNRQIKV